MGLIISTLLRYDRGLEVELRRVTWKAEEVYFSDREKLNTFMKPVNDLKDIINANCEVDDEELLAAFKGVINQCELLQAHLREHPKKYTNKLQKAGQIALNVLTAAWGIGTIGGMIGLIIWCLIKAPIVLGAAFLGLAGVLIVDEGILYGLSSAAEHLDGATYRVNFEDEEYSHLVKLKKELELQIMKSKQNKGPTL